MKRLITLTILLRCICCCYAQEDTIIWEQPAWALFEDVDHYLIVDEMPEFPGGNDKIIDYIQQNIKYPVEACEDKIQGRVFVNFIVEPDGSLSDIFVIRGIGGGCDEEAMRIIQNMPKWKPGKLNGEIVRCSCTVPVVFEL